MINKFNNKKTKHIKTISKVLSFFYKKPKRVGDFDIKNITNILIVDFALIGDMIMLIPFLRTLRRNSPKAKITLVCESWGKTVLKNQNLVDEFIIFNGKDKLSSPFSIIKNFFEIKNVLKIINKKNYDIGYEPKGDFRHTLFLHYTNCKMTVSYNYTGGEYLITDSFTPKKETEHLLDEKLDLLEFTGLQVYDEDRIPEYNLTKDDLEYRENFIKENNLENKFLFGIHPGASVTTKTYKDYDKLLPEICKIFKEEPMFILFEGPKEKVIINKIIEELEKLQKKYIVVNTTLEKYLILTSVPNINLCMDSASCHISSALGVQTFIIYGASIPQMGLPKSRGNLFYISDDLPCKPCNLPTCPYKTFECIRRISTNKICDILKDAICIVGGN